MGRAGGGGHVGGGFSGGGHRSSSFSGGGHYSRPSGSSSRTSSSRAGSSRGSSFSGARSSSPPKNNHNSPTIIHNHYGGGFGGFGGLGGFRSTSGGVGCSGCSFVFVVFIIIVVLIIIFATMIPPSPSYSSSAAVPGSSYNREKLEGTTWTNNCVVDETGWIEEDGSISGLERQLRKFYDKTGIQPYVYLVGYDPALSSQNDKEKFAEDYYAEYIDNSYTFAFFYFAERSDNDVGYMYYVGGSGALGIMDAEAIEIFWSITDQEWYGYNTTEDCIANIFNRTADRIMTKSTTSKDIVKIVLIIVLVIVIVVAIIIIMNKRRKNEKERNEETRRILETPLE